MSVGDPGLTAGMAIAAGFGEDTHAQSAPGRCDYTYISDDGCPHIGKSGEIKYNDNWKKGLRGQTRN